MVLQTLCANEAVSVREKHGSFGLKDSECGGGGGPGHRGLLRLHRPPLPWFILEGV